ncbi:Fe2+-dicitrate sensor, membrane component [Caulobacter sp. AP07]|uniref:FecR family protein n=1 Tax=Caulobacter sp. AP07 TaxID=1144304 RepID=UPI000271E32F|nr:FecR domain-containing protein [Caulobacter sp. AP07]EJL38460.1 Fe2+-dicitrate sensor, membrane component [Caulobacter sp. AP07]
MKMKVDDEDALAEAAARWVLRLRETPDDALLARHAAWLAEGPDRALAMAEAEAVLRVMDLALGPDRARPRRVRETTARPGRRAPIAVAITAGLAACVVLAIGSGQFIQGPRDGTRLSTVVGAMRRQALADGSQVTLNTDTVLDVRYRNGERKVRLVKGEAFFDVVHDPGRPFIVESRAGRAQVLGTAFDVRLRGKNAQVSVLRGAVRVEPARARGATVVRAGQGAWLGDATPLAQVLEDPAAIDAWRHGRLVVYRRPLAEVVEEIDRYRGGRIILRGEASGRRLVSGAFDIGQPDAALDALTASLGLRAARLGGFVLIY